MPHSARTRSFSGPRAAARRRRRRIVLSVILCVLVAALLAGVWYLTRLPSLTITEVEVTGGVTVNEDALRARLAELLDGSYVFLVPKRFAYAYPHDALVAVLEREPRVARARVAREGRTLTATVTEHLPVALWCEELERPDGCVFLAAGGEAFAAAPSLAGAVLRRYVTQGRPPEAGGQFASAQSLAETEGFAEALRTEHSMRVRAVVETTDGDLRYLLLGGGELIVAPDASVEEVFENLSSVLGSEEFAHLAPGNFAYIDLRFGNRVFVNEEVGGPQETATSTATSTLMTE